MSSPAADMAYRLAREAEAVCRHYLSNGRRHGRYWSVGDTDNTPGRSLYVRLVGPEAGPGAAGKWTDSATGEHGDLLDLIARRAGCRSIAETLDEARRFLTLRRPDGPAEPCHPAVPGGSPEAARRLFAAARPIPDTPAEAYLRARGITGPLSWPCLRFHPAAWYRADRTSPREAWPALLAAVTDDAGRITGIQRTWLARQRPAKAPITDPRRALGMLLGGGVRFGRALNVLIAGEGIETVLALKSLVPEMPMVAALSANHLAGFSIPPSLARLYVACDLDEAGRRAAERLRQRAGARGVAVFDLLPECGDFNADLCRSGAMATRARLAAQFAAADRARYLAD